VNEMRMRGGWRCSVSFSSLEERTKKKWQESEGGAGRVWRCARHDRAAGSQGRQCASPCDCWARKRQRPWEEGHESVLEERGQIGCFLRDFARPVREEATGGERWGWAVGGGGRGWMSRTEETCGSCEGEGRNHSTRELEAVRGQGGDCVWCVVNAMSICFSQNASCSSLATHTHTPPLEGGSVRHKASSGLRSHD
jgi:hypothetical protein